MYTHPHPNPPLEGEGTYGARAHPTVFLPYVGRACAPKHFFEPHIFDSTIIYQACTEPNPLPFKGRVRVGMGVGCFTNSSTPSYWRQHNIRCANISFHRKKPLRDVLSPTARGRGYLCSIHASLLFCAIAHGFRFYFAHVKSHIAVLSVCANR